MDPEIIALINNYKLLSKDEEYHLFNKMANGTKIERAEAKETLIMANLRLVVSLTRRHQYPNDAFCYGVVGLMSAIEKFDISTGNRLSTYATWWIRQALSRHMKAFGRSIYIPNYIQTRLRAVYKLIEWLNKNNKDISSLTDTELEALTQLEPKSVRFIYKWMQSKTIRIHMMENPDDVLQARLTSPVYESDEIADLHKCLKGINKRDRTVLQMRYGIAPYDRSYTLSEIGDKLSLSRERIRQIVVETTKRLRSLISKPSCVKQCIVF